MSPPLAGTRVLFVCRSTTFHTNSGGMETSANALIGAVQQLGAKTALVTTAVGSGDLPAGLDGHDAVWTVATSHPGRYSREWWNRTGTHGPWLDWQPDIIIGEGDAAASLTGRSLTTPVLVHAHGTTMMEARSALRSGLRGLPRAVLNLARTPHRSRHLRAATGVLAAGPAIRDSLERWPYRVPEARLDIVANSVALPDSVDMPVRARLLRDLDVPDGVPLLLAAGRLAADKGFDTAIRTAAKVPDAHLLIIGEGPEENRLRKLVASIGLQNTVHFLGRRDHALTLRVVLSVDALVFPTRRREGLPMIVLEAAACGLPVITTHNAGLPSDLRSHNITVVAPNASPEVFARAVCRHLELGRRAPYLPADYSRATLPARLRPLLAKHIGRSP